MKSGWTFLALVPMTLAGCSAGDGAVSHESQPILGGAVDNGDLAVGLLFAHQGSFVAESCSGTLIAPDIVLTAGHCFNTNVMDTFYVGQGVPIPSGDTDWQPATIGMRSFAIDAWVRPPDYVVAQTCPAPDVDIAVAHLSAPVDGVTPISLATAPPPDGAIATVVGFGRHPIDNLGDYLQLFKQRAQIAVTAALPTALFQSSNATGVPLPGDSGGPLLYDGAIVGTVSCGDGPALAQTNQFYARVDVERAWVCSELARYGRACGPSSP